MKNGYEKETKERTENKNKNKNVSKKKNAQRKKNRPKTRPAHYVATAQKRVAACLQAVVGCIRARETAVMWCAQGLVGKNVPKIK
jgi:hypothetical protein